jgi:hypothetical protein
MDVTGGLNMTTMSSTSNSSTLVCFFELNKGLISQHNNCIADEIIRPCQVRLTLLKPFKNSSTCSEDPEEGLINCIYCEGKFDGKMGLFHHVQRMHQAIDTFSTKLSRRSTRKKCIGTK